MEATRVRLALAEVKTNSVHQRATIAAAVIIPKLLYVGRHAWPSEELVKKAIRCIGNFVWNASFSDPGKSPTGWINKAVAEQKPAIGGIGMPNLQTELIAMSATRVGDWGLTTNEEKQVVGAILQTRDQGKAEAVVPSTAKPGAAMRNTLWESGKQWAEYAWGMVEGNSGEDESTAQETRRLLKHKDGLRTRWTSRGLELLCTGVLRDQLRRRRKTRREKAGYFIHEAFVACALTEIKLWSPTGDRIKWSAMGDLIKYVSRSQIQDLVTITCGEGGAVFFWPVGKNLPLDSKVAHLFREVCLSLVANYPEIMDRGRDGSWLCVHHPLADKRHEFGIIDEVKGSVSHTWGGQQRRVPWKTNRGDLEVVVAKTLDVAPENVWIAPHPSITRLKALWTGARRWSLSRRRCKRLVGQSDFDAACQVQEAVTRKWESSNKEVAKALKQVSWDRLHKLAGLSAYQVQNLIRLKLRKLRVWAGENRGFKCPLLECANEKEDAVMHLVWTCPVARRHWEAFVEMWGCGDVRDTGSWVFSRQIIDAIFGLTLANLPVDILKWGQSHNEAAWEVLHDTSTALWAIGCAIIVTTLWRRRIEDIHPTAKNNQSVEGSIAVTTRGILEAYRRYQLSLLPLVPTRMEELNVVEYLIDRCRHRNVTAVVDNYVEVTRVGFFQGGSRGNSGHGGSGSVIVEYDEDRKEMTSVWAAATALGNHHITNNVAVLWVYRGCWRTRRKRNGPNCTWLEIVLWCWA